MSETRVTKIPSAIPYYLCAAVWVVYAFVRPLYGLVDILICAALSVAALLAAKKLIKPREVTVFVPADTGDAALNAQIAEGRAQLQNLAGANDALPGAFVSERLDRIVKAGGAIFDELEKAPEKAGQVRRFMNYYLPTCVKLTAQYRALEHAGGENAAGVRQAVERGLDTMAASFEKLQNNLYGMVAIDVTSEIQALQTILASEGLSQDA